MDSNRFEPAPRRAKRIGLGNEQEPALDQNHLSGVLRSLSRVPSRRDVLRGLAAVGLGLGLGTLPTLAEAKPRRKKRKNRKKRRRPKPAKPNQYGCLEANDPCRRHTQCCSGICTGKRGRKRCRTHGAGTCNRQGPDLCSTAADDIGLLRCNGDPNSFCFPTTAGSIFCGATFGYMTCASCKRDTDCLALGLPPGSACVEVANGYCTLLGCQTRTACMAPGGIYPATAPAP